MSESTQPAVRVVLVDDHALVRAGLAALLDGSGQVSVVGQAADGARAVELVTEMSPDVVLMDLSMPVMDGIAATRAIRALPTPYCLAPIVATTANVLSHQIKTYRESGMNGCVAKPISPAALLNELARLANDDAQGLAGGEALSA